MKKLPLVKFSIVMVLTMLTGGAFFVPNAFAQSAPSGHFVLISQGILSTTSFASTTPDLGIAQWYIRLGTGLTGTTTGAYLGASYVLTGNPGNIPATLNIYSSPDDSYGSMTLCGNYQSPYVAGSYSAPIQLESATCVLQPDLFYTVEIAYLTSTPNANFTSFGGYQGEATSTHPSWVVIPEQTDTLNPNFVPYFAIVADGFQITPTTSSSGVFLSGALDFCATYFASSSAPAIVVDTGVALCDVGGFLFVPTAESLQQFGNYVPNVQGKIPFSYFYDAASIFGGLQASSTENFPQWSYSLSQIDFASSTAMGQILPTSLTFLSSSTINTFLPPGMHDLLYNLMIFAIWVDVAFVLYHKIVPTKAKI